MTLTQLSYYFLVGWLGLVGPVTGLAGPVTGLAGPVSGLAGPLPGFPGCSGFIAI